MAYDQELIQRAIAKQNGQPYGVGLGAASTQLDPMAAMTSPNVPPVAEQAVIRTIEPAAQPSGQYAADKLLAQHQRYTPAGMAQPDPAQQPAPVAQPPQDPALQGDGAIARAMGELDALVGQQGDAALRIGDQTARSAARSAEAGEKYLKEADVLAAHHMDKSEAVDAIYRQTMDEYRSMNEQIAKMPPITGRTGAQKAWGALAMLGASISDVYTGGDASKQVQGMLSQAAQRNIELQEANYANKRKSAESKLSEVGLARQYLGDTREATQFAVALRKDRLATAMDVEANKLTSLTARDKAQQFAAGVKADAKKEQLDILKKVLGHKMSAMEAAMLVKLGVISPEEAKLQMGVGTGDGTAAGPAPAAKVIGKMTTSQQGQVNIAGHQASVGPWRAKDPSKADPVQTRKVQDYYAQNRIYTNALSELENLYRDATDPRLPEDQQRLAMTTFGIKRDEAIAKLSQKDDQGVVTNPEFARKIESLKAPPANLVEEGVRAVQESWNRTISGPQVFESMRESAARELGVMMESRDWVREDAPTAPSASPAKPKQGGGGAVKRPKRAAVATSPEDFD